MPELLTMPSWFSRLFAIKSPRISRTLTKDGVVIHFDNHASEGGVLTSTQALGYVQQLAGEERLIESEDGLLLSWNEVYKIREEPQGAAELEILALPPMRQLAPSLRSENTLTSAEFVVAVDGWRDRDRRPVEDVSISGAVAFIGRDTVLLPRASHELMRRLAHFYDEPQRDENYNRCAWGELRELAIAAGAALDQFLFSNLIVTPERLVIELGRRKSGGVGVVEIEPWFAGAPDNWLQHFDSFAKVRDLYEIPTKDGIVQVIVTPKVKRVLEAIKQMPGRRVAGALAERFVSNPFATLGGTAGDVIDPNQFDQAREEAGISFQRFTARVNTDADGFPSEVGVLIESATSHDANSAYERFSDARELGHFINGIQSRLETGGEIYFWRGYDLQLLGDTPREVETLTLAFNAWTRPRITIRYADVADLRRYSERVIGIGIQKPLISPHIPRRDEEGSWFPENLASGVDSASRPVVATLSNASGTSFEVVVTPEVAQEVKARIERAKEIASPNIEWPESSELVPLATAEETVAQVEQNWTGSADHSGNPAEQNAVRRARERKELLLRANVESAEYLENHKGALRFDATRAPLLPSSLSTAVKLKDHQIVGVAWMQHLLEQSPDYCRGAVLADDMGLGKTLQLLAVIARRLEDDPNTAPILIVAPVSLLENWKEEAQRFFAADTFKMLTLYGDTLSNLREMPTRIEDQLRKEGMVRFLKPGWLGNHKVVMTTYETLRDLEFSLAAMRWSLMVCDEAQKIKNPAAMVTRAAKKQNVAFKIACTGTPVENSLADLWCLFDYVQPGLLGALNEFGEKYRRPIECESDQEKMRVEELRNIVEPQILRRTKKDVAKDLPPKVIDEDVQKLQISPLQRRLYGEALDLFKMRRDPARSVPFKNHLGLLHYLRRLCTDPRKIGKEVFVPEPISDYRCKSPKLDWLLRTLEMVRDKKEKAIVFCEFRDMQRMLVHYIQEFFRYKPDVINGDTETSTTHAQSRQKRIRAFQDQPGFGVIVLSPIAVGFGVNIQAANHVIHFTRTWNPAKEDQATDRAYRIGQTKTVYVYYPVVRADDFKTFDVKLHELLDSKRKLSGDMLNGTGNVLPNEFDDVIGVGGNVFEDRITIDDAVQLQPDYFEALTAALWKKRGFRTVIVTPTSNDHGVDVVAKTQRNGELIQCKSSSVPGKQLDWDAVKDVVTGHAAYKVQYPGTQFKLVCITNQYFNEKTQRMAGLNNVELIDQTALKILLDSYRVTLGDVEAQLVDRVGSH